MTVTLFLDIDGVLHSHPGEEARLFSQMPLFLSVVDNVPNVDIVISSAWRRATPIEVLRMYFPERIRARIISVTPVLRSSDSPYTAVEFERQLEIQTWMSKHRPHQHWVAVDDWVYNFEPGCERLVLTNPENGLTETTSKRLLQLLQSMTY